MKNYKRLMCAVLAALLVLSVCGCGQESGGVGESTVPVNTDPTGTTVGIEDTAAPTQENMTTATDPTQDETSPSEDPSTEPTGEATKPTQGVTEPEETEPKATKPAETEPKDTEPKNTEPKETQHTHSYSSKVVNPTCTEKGYTLHECSCGASYKDSEKAAKGHSYNASVVNPTCTEKGYTKHTCSNCNNSYTDNETAAKGHSYTDTVVDPTTEAQGYTVHTCSVCGDTYTDSYTAKLEVKISTVDIQNAIIKYINQFRNQEGTASLTYLPGMTQVAKYRSQQLTTNCAHDTADMREALAYYKYGEYIDMSEYGYESYWAASTQEAIGYTTRKNPKNADEVASDLANACHDSAGHWAYVGNAENLYVGVGVTQGADGYWYCCIMVGPINYG